MVGKRHSSGSSSKRSPVASEPALANRPKRNISPKCLDVTMGLSWREERELKKALYASLQQSKKPPTPKSETSSSSFMEGNTTPSTSKSGSSESSTPTLSLSQPKLSRISSEKGKRNGKSRFIPSRGQRASSLPNVPVTKLAKLRQLRDSGRQPETPEYAFNKSHDLPLMSNSNSGSNSVDDSSQDSTSGSSLSTTPSNSKCGATATGAQENSRAKVHAQRKFASMQNCGRMGYSSYSPNSPPRQSNKVPATKVSPTKIFPKRAKTEDFLTFLCLRGTPALPPHLDFLNFTRYDGTNYQSPSKPTRESSPSSTSTSLSNFPQDDSGENSRTFSPVSKLITPNKKAARACAGTPETARGLQGARPRLTKNSLKAQSPLVKTKVSKPKVKTSKITRSSSLPGSSQKSGMTRRSSEMMPLKLGAANRLAMKRKAVATLNSQRSSEVISKKPILNVNVKVEDKDTENKETRQYCKEEFVERSVTTVGRELRVRVNLRKPKRKQPSDFIAMRLPKRQAKENALKFYMESDDLEINDDSSRSTSDEEITFPKKRKLDSGYDIDLCKIPFKKSRLLKSEKKTKKSANNKKLLRCSNELKKLTNGNPEQMKSKIDDKSNGVSTRSSSKDLESGPHVSAVKAFADKKLQKIKEMKRRVLSNSGKSTQELHNSDKHKQDLCGTSQEQRKEKEKSSVKCNISTLKQAKAKPITALNSKVKEIRDRKVRTNKKSDPELLTHKEEVHKEVSTSMTEVPTFFPTEEEFLHPIQYIQSISPMAEPFGMCKIIPPASWKTDGKVSEDIRFTTQKQYIHKMYKRFGPNVEQLECIRRHLENQNPSEPMQVPLVGGVEIDLCLLSGTIDKFGGMQSVIEKKKWMKVADAMNIPKLALDRGTKLYDAYCNCLLSFNGLSNEEKAKLSAQVKADRLKVRNWYQEEDCVVKGKNLSLAAFNKLARNTMSVVTSGRQNVDEAVTTEQIETEFWDIVTQRNKYTVVHGGHVDTKTQNCSLFSTKKDHASAKHPWNLNNLANHKSSLLQYLHHVSGVTVPTLHVGMLYTASCWATDTHHLPYVQYLHSEADTIWHCIPAQEENKFQTVMKELVPTLVNTSIQWLMEDTTMVPPDVLLQKGVHVSRCVQQPHQFVVVFPKCYTSTISCGYTLAESSHYATKEWLQLGIEVAKSLNKSCEEELFSMEELLCNIVEDPNARIDILQAALVQFEKIVDREISFRKVLADIGLKASKRMAVGVAKTLSTGRRNSTDLEEVVTRCEISKKICYLSLVLNEAEDLALCLEQGLLHLQKKKNLKTCKLLYRHTEEELKKILHAAKERIKSLQTLDGASGASGSKRSKGAQYEFEFQKFIDVNTKSRRKSVNGQKT